MHVTKDHMFKNEKLFYSFIDGYKEKLQVLSSSVYLSIFCISVIRTFFFEVGNSEKQSNSSTVFRVQVFHQSASNIPTLLTLLPCKKGNPFKSFKSNTN